MSTNRQFYWLLFSLAWPLYASVNLPQEAVPVYEGQVVGVSDGDTLTVLVGDREHRINLAEIDAPERSQDFGQRSRQSLADLVFDKQVIIESQGKDRHGRVLGRVVVNGIDVNAEQVRLGMAWVYREYAKDSQLFELEGEARAAKRGLWANPHAIPPWEHRREK